MKIFISWSGNRSRHVAYALKSWLPKVIQAVKPWMSDEDISAGTRWSAELAKELEKTTVGLICLTPENQHEPWIMFEAGALSKTIEYTYVVPYLIDLEPSQLSGPMAQFQSTLANKEGTAKILQTLNRALGNQQIQATELDEIFSVWWAKLEQELSNMPKVSNEGNVRRSANEILEEIVRNTREQLRREEVRLSNMQGRDSKLDEFLQKTELLMSGYLENVEAMPQRLKEVLKVAGKSRGKSGEQLSQIVDTLLDPDGLINMSKADLPNMMAELKRLQEQSREETQRILNRDADNSSLDEGEEAAGIPPTIM